MDDAADELVAHALVFARLLRLTLGRPSALNEMPEEERHDEEERNANEQPVAEQAVESEQKPRRVEMQRADQHRRGDHAFESIAEGADDHHDEIEKEEIARRVLRQQQGDGDRDRVEGDDRHLEELRRAGPRQEPGGDDVRAEIGGDEESDDRRSGAERPMEEDQVNGCDDEDPPQLDDALPAAIHGVLEIEKCHG